MMGLSDVRRLRAMAPSWFNADDSSLFRSPPWNGLIDGVTSSSFQYIRDFTRATRYNPIKFSSNPPEAIRDGSYAPVDERLGKSALRTENGRSGAVSGPLNFAFPGESVAGFLPVLPSATGSCEGIRRAQ